MHVAPPLAKARHQFVHNDLNSGNVLVDPANESVVAGIIDFGDAVHTALVADVAIAAVAQIIDGFSPQEAVADLVRGYQEIEPLLAPELEILNGLIAARMVSAVITSEWHRAKNPQSKHFSAFGGDFIRFALDRIPKYAGCRCHIKALFASDERLVVNLNEIAFVLAF